MKAKMGRSEWVSLVRACLEAGQTKEQAIESASFVVGYADSTFGTFEVLAAEDDADETESLESKLKLMLSYGEAFAAKLGEVNSKAVADGIAPPSMTFTYERTSEGIPVCPPDMNYQAWLRTLTNDELTLIENASKLNTSHMP